MLIMPRTKTEKEKVTHYLLPSTKRMLQDLVYVVKKSNDKYSQSEAIEEALQLLFKTPRVEKELE